MDGSSVKNLLLAAMGGAVLFVFGYLLGAEHVFPGVECFFGINSPGVSCL